MSVCPWAKRFSSTEMAIEALKLEYLGMVKRDGRTAIEFARGRVRFLRRTWRSVFGTVSSTPSRCYRCSATCSSGDATRYEFLYGPINEPIAQEKFQAPTGAESNANRANLKRVTITSFGPCVTVAMGRWSRNLDKWGRKADKAAACIEAKPTREMRRRWIQGTSGTCSSTGNSMVFIASGRLEQWPLVRLR